jgi:hypothetical protein
MRFKYKLVKIGKSTPQIMERFEKVVVSEKSSKENCVCFGGYLDKLSSVFSKIILNKNKFVKNL